MTLTVSQLRQNIYQILEQVIETGVPLEIEHKGKRLRIQPVEPHRRLDNLKRRDCLLGDPDDIVEIDWMQEWKP